MISVLWSGEIIVKFDDDINDDFGDGNVTYPEHPMFTQGLFDIEQFRIEEEEDSYLFIVRVRGKIDYVDFDEFEYRYNIPEDYIFPLLQIYIDTDHQHNSGIRETIFGVNATINEESGWEKAVIFTSIPQRFRLRMEQYQAPFVSRVVFSPKIYRSKDKKEIQVRVPKKFLGEIQPEWGYTILMLAHDVASTVKKNVFTMEVKATSSLFTFGGGHGALLKRYNSNIIDMLVPRFHSQKKILKQYSVKNKTLPEIGAVYQLKTEIKSTLILGKVTQISSDKVVINLGVNQGVEVGTKLIIDSQYIVEVDDVFPELCLAHYTNLDDAVSIEPEMEVKIWKE